MRCRLNYIGKEPTLEEPALARISVVAKVAPIVSQLSKDPFVFVFLIFSMKISVNFRQSIFMRGS